MRRRDVIAGLGAAGIFGTGAAWYSGAFDSFEDESRVDPVELPRIEAQGSSSGTETIPEPGSISYIAMFATWCGTCAAKMEPLGEAAKTAPDDVQFVSVTNEPVGQTIDETAVIDWWADHDGAWTVAHDVNLELSRRLDASGVPYSIVTDAENRIVWSDSGYKDADEILDRIEEAR